MSVSRSSSRRATQWIGPADQSYLAVAAVGATLISSFAFSEPAIVVRNRGMISVKPAAFTADLDIRGAFGMGIVSAEAFAAGVGSMPEPFSDADWGGWIVWRSFAWHFESGTASNDLTFPASTDFEIDSKAMRKASSNDVIVQIAESQGGAFNLFSGVRMLVKLHG